MPCLGNVQGTQSKCFILACAQICLYLCNTQIFYTYITISDSNQPMPWLKESISTFPHHHYIFFSQEIKWITCEWDTFYSWKGQYPWHCEGIILWELDTDTSIHHQSICPWYRQGFKQLSLKSLNVSVWIHQLT